MDIFERIFESTPDALLVVGADGRIARANQQAEVVFGHARERLVGMAVEQLIPDRFAQGHAHHRQHYLRGPRIRPMGAGLELFARRADGSECPVDIMLSPLSAPESDERAGVLCVVRDVTERRKVEQRVRDSLREKEVLLQEIHHRVKNNLAVISSLFSLQSMRATDPELVTILTDGQHRVRSMALVHETLYRSGNLAFVDFADYAVGLCRDLERGHRLPGRTVEMLSRMEPVTMHVDVAVPCGLILNELVANALKHAFADGRNGCIELLLRRTPDGRGILEVVDNGVGPGRALDAGGTSLGLRLITSLARQIDATFTLADAAPGTRATLVLPLEPS